MGDRTMEFIEALKEFLDVMEIEEEDTVNLKVMDNGNIVVFPKNEKGYEED